MPKMKLGMFSDSALERWYILWRADHIVCFYKETASLNMLLCALQCLFGMVQGVIMEYLKKLVGEPSTSATVVAEIQQLLQQ